MAKTTFILKRKTFSYIEEERIFVTPRVRVQTGQMHNNFLNTLNSTTRTKSPVTTPTPVTSKSTTTGSKPAGGLGWAGGSGSSGSTSGLGYTGSSTSSSTSGGSGRQRWSFKRTRTDLPRAESVVKNMPHLSNNPHNLPVPSSTSSASSSTTTKALIPSSTSSASSSTTTKALVPSSTSSTALVATSPSTSVTRVGPAKNSGIQVSSDLGSRAKEVSPIKEVSPTKVPEGPKTNSTPSGSQTSSGQPSAPANNAAVQNPQVEAAKEQAKEAMKFANYGAANAAGYKSGYSVLGFGNFGAANSGFKTVRDASGNVGTVALTRGQRAAEAGKGILKTGALLTAAGTIYGAKKVDDAASGLSG